MLQLFILYKILANEEKKPTSYFYNQQSIDFCFNNYSWRLGEQITWENNSMTDSDHTDLLLQSRLSDHTAAQSIRASDSTWDVVEPGPGSRKEQLIMGPGPCRPTLWSELHAASTKNYSQHNRMNKQNFCQYIQHGTLAVCNLCWYLSSSSVMREYWRSKDSFIWPPLAISFSVWTKGSLRKCCQERSNFVLLGSRLYTTIWTSPWIEHGTTSFAYQSYINYVCSYACRS